MREKNMEKALGTLINREITIFLDNKQFAEGVLLDVRQDYLAIDINEKIYYFTFAHIKAFTKKAKDLNAPIKRESPLSSNDFIGILTSLQNEWVTINCFSDQAFYGILSIVLEDYIIVTNNEELHYIATSYIANIHQAVFHDQLRQTKEDDIEIHSTTSEFNEDITMEDLVIRLLAVLKKQIDVSKEDVQEKQVNEKNEEPNINKESPIKINEKRILLTPWSQMNYDQNTIAIPATNRKKRTQVIAPPSELNETLKEEKLELPKTNESPIQAPIQRFEEQKTETFINPKEKKAMLKKQYYALMKHAGQNSATFDQNPLSDMENNLDNDERKKGENEMVEKQFYSLMRHAAKMYRKMRD
ncbi:hypothetical protein [Psychrobacillus sp. NPDC093180]|uniref:hypothetical protein n=1 Tax=Psychrobacillus sp. NPDC093180 TaxID=3364489 RepID=UPI00382F0024